METTIEIEQNIFKITSKINNYYPELMKYMSEMRISNAQDETVNRISLLDYYHSLEDLVYKYANTRRETFETKNLENSKFADLQIYPVSEDIYQQFKEETEINPEDISKKKMPSEKEGTWNEKGFNTIKTGADLDVPGAELDDQQENIGSEDEENNYYSLGGDNHNDLEEDKE